MAAAAHNALFFESPPRPLTPPEPWDPGRAAFLDADVDVLVPPGFEPRPTDIYVASHMKVRAARAAPPIGPIRCS